MKGAPSEALYIPFNRHLRRIPFRTVPLCGGCRLRRPSHRRRAQYHGHRRRYVDVRSVGDQIMTRTLFAGWVAGHHISIYLNELDIADDGGAEHVDVCVQAPDACCNSRSCSLVGGALEGSWYKGWTGEWTGELEFIPPAIHSFLKAVDRIVDGTNFNTSNWGKE